MNGALRLERCALVASLTLLIAGCTTTVQDLGGDDPNGGSNRLEPGDGKQLATGGNSTCFRRADGVVKCWGQNDRGQLGVATQDMCGLLDCTKQPFTSPALHGVTSVALGGRFGCAISSAGTSSCWGENSFGELGRGTNDTDPHLEPIAVELTEAQGIWLGQHHGCAITAAGDTLCWGLGEDGQLGLDPTTLERCAVPDDLAGTAGVPTQAEVACARQPTLVPAFEGALELALGEAHSCARFADGRVSCVGRGSQGQLGDGQLHTRSFDVIPALDSGASAVFAGSSHTCAVSDQRVRCWGDNVAGQLGVGSAVQQTCAGNDCSLAPTLVGDLPDVATLALGARFTCAALVSGDVRCWGDDSSGQLGNSSLPNEACKPSGAAAFPCLPRPNEPAYELHGVLELRAGLEHVCALVSGELRCWGSSRSGQGWGNSEATFPSAIYGLN